jgi:hypothetical protein
MRRHACGPIEAVVRRKALVGCVSCGEGFALLSALPLGLIYPGGRLLPLKLRAFTDFVVPRLKQTLIFDP